MNAASVRFSMCLAGLQPLLLASVFATEPAKAPKLVPRPIPGLAAPTSTPPPVPHVMTPSRPMPTSAAPAPATDRARIVAIHRRAQLPVELTRDLERVRSVMPTAVAPLYAPVLQQGQVRIIPKAEIPQSSNP